MARPSKPEDQRAALVVGVRLTPAEKALVDPVSYTHLTLPTNREV